MAFFGGGGGATERNGAFSVNTISARENIMKPIVRLSSRPGARVA